MGPQTANVHKRLHQIESLLTKWKATLSPGHSALMLR